MLRLFTDSDTDMTPLDCQKYGYTLIKMPYVVDEKAIYPYRDFEQFDAKSFYDMLRKGNLPTTCALNPEEYKEYFEPVLAAGDDILYVHFSAAMSGTFNFMNIAIQELKEKYPERNVYTIDTKGITILANVVVKEVGDLFLQGKTVEELLYWAKTEVDKFACYFYADDLKFFKRSGRVSGLAATMGSLFSIKPIIYIGQDGKMTSIGKVRGRKNALKHIFSQVVDLQDDIKNHHVVVGHTDCEALAQELILMLKQHFGDDLIVESFNINPTAGSHSGPDCVGVAFHSIHR